MRRPAAAVHVGRSVLDREPMPYNIVFCNERFCTGGDIAPLTTGQRSFFLFRPILLAAVARWNVSLNEFDEFEVIDHWPQIFLNADFGARFDGVDLTVEDSVLRIDLVSDEEEAAALERENRNVVHWSDIHPPLRNVVGQRRCGVVLPYGRGRGQQLRLWPRPHNFPAYPTSVDAVMVDRMDTVWRFEGDLWGVFPPGHQRPLQLTPPTPLQPTARAASDLGTPERPPPRRRRRVV